MSFIYHTFFFDPLYNLMVLLLSHLTWLDAGVVVIILTVLVRLIMFPLSRKAVVTQMRMNEVAPELEEIKAKFKDKPEEQAKQTLALYQKYKINPFAGVLVIIIQIPLIFALYRIFLHFTEVRTDILYSFVTAPQSINTHFIGLIDISQSSIILALLAALSTFLQLYLSPVNKKADPKAKTSDFAQVMQTQMKYFFPVMVFFISYKISAVIALYWLTTNLFSVAQEIVIKKRHLAQA